MKAIVILGDQLFDPVLLEKKVGSRVPVFMAEDLGLCTHFKYHQQKLVFFLSAMRHFRAELEVLGWRVDYHSLDKNEQLSYFEKIRKFCEKNKIVELISYEISDRFFESQFIEFCQKRGIKWTMLESPGFLTPRAEFKTYLSQSKKPFMKVFYERQRKRLKILVDQEGDPVGDQWSFDEDNRQKLPKKINLPLFPEIEADEITRDTITLVTEKFGAHPGRASQLWLPTTREEAKKWLQIFVQERLKEFGPYEDAISNRAPFLFHGVLTPFLNSGLLTPHEVISVVLKAHVRAKLPMNSVEGFIRQIIGWREFIFGIDRNFYEKQWTTNQWKHQRKLKDCWYEGNTGIPPLDDVIKKTVKYGYAHHIERLMIVGNMMLLCEIHPHEAHRWFMEMFIDSADWVMGPNVFGMGISSDGGIFATKPYICGSNYWLKMSDYSKGEWCDVVDGLYWRFIKNHQAALLKNPRMGTMARALDKIAPGRKETIFKAAALFLNQVTSA